MNPQKRFTAEVTAEVKDKTPASQAATVSLKVTAGPHAGQHWTFDRPTTLILGRESPANIRLANESAFSKRHCEIRINPPMVHLVDLKSTNGTLVNGIPVAEAILSDGDEFGVGDTTIQVAVLSLREVVPTEANADATIMLQAPTSKPTAESEATAHYATGYQPELVQSSQESTNFGAFELIDKIGEGGMACVYSARHRKTGDMVAIKLIRTAGPPSPKMLQLFIREASVLLRLNHPRIVRSIEFGFQDHQPFLVMEWIPTVELLPLVDAMTLEQRIRMGCWIVSRVLQALAYAHEQGIVHRDIKPGNILAYREKHRLQVKLGDFGLAKCYEDAGFSAMTDENSLRGTLAYMAPEQLKDSRLAGPPSDIFAAGACLYRLVTGKHPIMTARGVECDMNLLKQLNLPPRLIQVLGTAMNLEIENRFKSASAMEQYLQPFHGK